MGDVELHLQSRQANSNEIDGPPFRGRKKQYEVAENRQLMYRRLKSLRSLC
jgi:hypothetical protein